MTGSCELCGRVRSLTFHHLIPRTTHSNKWFRKNFTREQMATGLDLCSDCHSAIHRFVPNEKQLGREYNTKDKLLGIEQLATFVEWVSKQSDERRFRVRTKGGRKRR